MQSMEASNRGYKEGLINQAVGEVYWAEVHASQSARRAQGSVRAAQREREEYKRSGADTVEEEFQQAIREARQEARQQREVNQWAASMHSHAQLQESVEVAQLQRDGMSQRQKRRVKHKKSAKLEKGTRGGAKIGAEAAKAELWRLMATSSGEKSGDIETPKPRRQSARWRLGHAKERLQKYLRDEVTVDVEDKGREMEAERALRQGLARTMRKARELVKEDAAKRKWWQGKVEGMKSKAAARYAFACGLCFLQRAGDRRRCYVLRHGRGRLDEMRVDVVRTQMREWHRRWMRHEGGERRELKGMRVTDPSELQESTTEAEAEATVQAELQVGLDANGDVVVQAELRVEMDTVAAAGAREGAQSEGEEERPGTAAFASVPHFQPTTARRDTRYWSGG